jgi:hypothetical protein
MENLNRPVSEEISNPKKTAQQYQQYQHSATASSSTEKYDYCGRHMSIEINPNIYFR